MGCFKLKYNDSFKALLIVLVFFSTITKSQSIKLYEYNDSLLYSKNKSIIYSEIAKLISDYTIEEIDSLCCELSSSSKPHYYLQIAKYLFIHKQYNKCRQFLDKTLLIADTTIGSHHYIMPDCYFYFGKVSSVNNEVIELVNNFEVAASYYKKQQAYDNLAITCLEIANYFSRSNNLKYADQYYEEVLSVKKHITNKRVLNLVKFNLANHLNKKKEYNKSIALYRELEADSTKLSEAKLGLLKNNIGVILLKQKRYELSYEYLTNAYNIRLRLGDKNQLTSTLNNLFYLSLELGYLEQSRVFKEELEELLEDCSDSENNLSFIYNCITFYLKTDDKLAASNYFKQYINLKDSITNSTFSEKLIEMQKGFELKEKDQEIALLQKEDALNKAHLKTKNILIGVTASFLLILLVVGYLINRQRKELAQSRRRLMRQKEDITGMNEQLRVSNLAKDRILAVIGHDLRGPVGGLKELIELYMELPEYEPHDIENLLKSAREASTSTYHLLENLLSWANSQRGDIVYSPVATPIAPLVKQSVNLLDKSINTRNVIFKYDIPEALVMQVDLNMLRTIIRNLVSNALKYSPENGTITVGIDTAGNSTTFYVSDQGKGMTAEETQSIFKKKETYFIGSELTAKGTGLGLILCKEFVERHGGSIWIDSELGVGTKVCFTIPQKKTKSNEVEALQSIGAQ